MHIYMSSKKTVRLKSFCCTLHFHIPHFSTQQKYHTGPYVLLQVIIFANLGDFAYMRKMFLLTIYKINTPQKIIKKLLIRGK
jgi:hypothetical protein